MPKLSFPIILCAFLIVSCALPTTAGADSYSWWNSLGESEKSLVVMGIFNGFLISSDIVHSAIKGESIKIGKPKKGESSLSLSVKQGRLLEWVNISSAISDRENKLLLFSWEVEQIVRAIDQVYSDPAYQQLSMNEATIKGLKDMRAKLEEEKQNR